MSSGLMANRYEILGELGAGSMGVVWRAHDQVLDRPVALKELRVTAGVGQEQALERFVTEARAAARLAHPAIVTVHDVFQESDRVLLSMELLEGHSLDLLIESGQVRHMARSIMREVASALAAAHMAGVVHRDLKPDNIVLTDSGRVVVCDFGLARIGEGAGTRAGTIMGTPGFMAPEQITGDPVGPAADVFAWGAVAYELVTGSPAFGDRVNDTAMALAYRVVHEQAPLLRVDEDPDLAMVIATALSKDAADRFSDGVALLDALDVSQTRASSVEGSGPGAAARTAPQAGRRDVSPRRSWGWPLAIAGATTVLVALIAVLVALIGQEAPAPSAVATIAPAARQRSSASPAPAVEGPVTPLAVTADATAPDGMDARGRPVSYDPRHLVDGDPVTAWRTPGDGVGAIIRVQLAAPTRLTSVGLIPGYDKVDASDGTDRWLQNRRPLLVRWTFDDGSSVEQRLQDRRDMQVMDVDVTTSTITLEIVGSSAPTERNFTAISEIALRGDS